MAKDFLTDEQVEAEIDRLRQSANVKLAQLENRIKYKRRQYMYQLRFLEKRGRELRSRGITEESLRQLDIDDADIGEVS